MGFRFRRSLRVLPGVRLNVSKSGTSWTFGGRGASVNVGKRGTFVNTGIPGSGLSYRQKVCGARPEGQGQPTGGFGAFAAIVLVAFLVLVLMGMCAQA